MTSPFSRLSLIVNPQAGRRRLDALVERIEGVLAEQGLEHDVWVTEGPGDATSVARRTLDHGGRFLVAVGGDGTVHEVVNGMVAHDAAVAGDAVLGVIAAGSGCDLIRTFGLPARPAAAARRLAGADVRPLDVARIDYVDLDGRAGVRYFANIAEAGLGASTAAQAEKVPRCLGQSRYFFAFWATLPSYRPGNARVEVDGGLAYEGRAVNVVVANCRYFGGGMHISPRSEPADGTLEVLVFNGRKTDSFTMLPKVYRGRHMPHPDIVELSGRRFHLEAEPPLAIEADGEVLGTTPATVEVIPRAITLKV